ncbi:MAG TPA: hypothetical protein VFO70_11540, partial [Chitinophagaceae bacterium]|nr:hypothetical protein [Chitinophagaceae bacterium]
MNSFFKNVSTSNSIGFFSLRNKVTRLENGFNFTPIAGFNNVYKALVEGYATGIIVGSRFLRDD